MQPLRAERASARQGASARGCSPQRSRRASQSASPRSTQESLGFGAKSAAAIPSYAVSGEPAVLAVRSLNLAREVRIPCLPSLARGLRAPRLAAFSTFSTSLSLSRARADTRADTRADAVPAFAFAIRRRRIRRLLVPALFPAGGTRCAALTRAGRALTFPSGGAGDVARCAVDPTRTGFGSPGLRVGLSDNAGSAGRTRREHAVVSRAAAGARAHAAEGTARGSARAPVGRDFGGSRRAGARRGPAAARVRVRRARGAGGAGRKRRRLRGAAQVRGAAARRRDRDAENGGCFTPGAVLQPATVPAERSKARARSGRTHRGRAPAR